MELRKRIYVAGPYTSDPDINTEKAIGWGQSLLEGGYAPLVPHLTHFWQTQYFDNPHEDWMAIDLPWVRAADAVLRLPGGSRGADEEVALAHANGIPVFMVAGTADRMIATLDAYFASHSTVRFTAAPDTWASPKLRFSVHPKPEPEPLAGVPAAILSALEMIESIFKKKNADYADERTSWRSNFQDVARQMGVEDIDAADTLIAVKQARLRALRSNGRPPTNEAASDTYLDRAVYAVIALAMLIEDDQFIS